MGPKWIQMGPNGPKWAPGPLGPWALGPGPPYLGPGPWAHGPWAPYLGPGPKGALGAQGPLGPRGPNKWPMGPRLIQKGPKIIPGWPQNDPRDIWDNFRKNLGFYFLAGFLDLTFWSWGRALGPRIGI